MTREERILTQLARQEPEQAIRSARALAADVDVEALPEELPAQLLAVLRHHPDYQQAVAYCEATGGEMQSFALPDWGAAAALVAMLLLLFQPSLHGDLKLDWEHVKARLRLDLQPADLETVKTIVHTLLTLLGKAPANGEEKHEEEHKD